MFVITVVDDTLITVTTRRDAVRMAVVRPRVPDAAVIAGSDERAVADGDLTDEDGGRGDVCHGVGEGGGEGGEA